MSLYTVEALDPSTGQMLTERVEADSVDNATAQLNARGLRVVDVRQAKSGLSMEISFLSGRVKGKDLAVFSRQFATMMAAGMPMLRSLSVLIRQTANPKLKETLQAIAHDVEAGMSLSDAVAVHDKVFPPLMVAMIKSGEVGGFLDTAMHEIATSIEKDVKLRGQIKSALTYPVAVMIMAVLGTTGMLIFVVPTFTQMFTDMGGELPLPTRIVVAMSDFLKVAIWPAIPIGIAAGVLWRKNKNTEKVRNIVDPLKLKMPIFGPLLLKIALARFTRNLSVMLRSGVPILESLKVVADTSGNNVVRDSVLNAAKFIEAGEALSAHLGDGGIIPDMVVQMVAVGEDTGAMDQMLEKVSAFYETEVEATTDQLSSLMEPILIVSMGVILGALVVAMYLPTFQIFNLIE